MVSGADRAAACFQQITTPPAGIHGLHLLVNF